MSQRRDKLGRSKKLMRPPTLAGRPKNKAATNDNKRRRHVFSGSYLQYMQSKQWQSLRKQVFKLKGRKCSICGSIDNLQVHHLTYVRLFFEKMKDLIVLCQGCHENEHEGKRGVVADPITREYLMRSKNY